MFSKTSVAVLAGIAVAGSILVAPGVVAAPTAGRAAAWRNNYFGHAGGGTTSQRSVPVAVTGPLAGKTVTAVAAGTNHSCAVAGGRVFCWGYPTGPLPLVGGTYSYRSVPKAVTGVLAGKTVNAVAAGTHHSCAVADGQVFCWGDNFLGELGDGQPNGATDSKVPVAVDTSGALAGRTVTAVAAGGARSCAVADGQVFCWGRTGHGVRHVSVPVAVDTSGVLADKTVTAVTAGVWHTCAVADGKAYCWGWNDAGQVGDGATTDRSVPVAVTGVLAGKTVTAVSAGDGHTCAVADGKAYCWGWNGFGQVGDGATTDRLLPVAVDTSGALAGRTVTAVAAGGADSCALADGRAFCWGNNLFGQLGDGTTTDRLLPVAVDTSGALAGRTVTAVAAGHALSCAVADGQMYCWGSKDALRVTGVKAVVKKGTVNITWKAVAGATNYSVWITKPGGKRFKMSKSTTEPVFKATVRKGKKYRFQVAATGPGGELGPFTMIWFKGK